LIVDVCVPALQVPSKSFEEMLRRELPVNRILYSEAKPLGTARQQLIEAVSTDWFVFVDTDVELLPGWFDMVWSMVDDRTGAVDGFCSLAVFQLAWGLCPAFLYLRRRKSPWEISREDF